MALVAGPRNRQKYAPQVEGPMQPQPTNVIEAYQQGGIPGALSMIFNAPDPGIGPMAVVQKAGAASLRPFLIKQTAQELAKWGGGQTLRTMADVPQARKGAMDLAPMVQKTLAKIEKAQTGKPLSVVGHRAEGASGLVPSRGTFFSAKPSGAVSYRPVTKTSVREANRGFTPTAKRVEPVQFKNPLVFDQYGQGGAITELVLNPETKAKLSPALRKAGVAILKERGGEMWFTQADKWLARAAKLLGHDGIVYKDTLEIVDLAGTKNIPKRGASR